MATFEEFFNSITERCYNTAVKRGKSVKRGDCETALKAEMKEYGQAVDRMAFIDVEAVETAKGLPDSEFAEFYDKRLHNTIEDEQADALICAATWAHAVMLEPEMPLRGMNGEISRASADHKFLINIDIEIINCIKRHLQDNDPATLELILVVARLKMRYNELRKD